MLVAFPMDGGEEGVVEYELCSRRKVNFLHPKLAAQFFAEHDLEVKAKLNWLLLKYPTIHLRFFIERMNYLNYNRYAENSDQNASTNLDQDLRNSRSDKYAKNEPEAKQWIFDVLGLDSVRINEYKAHRLDLIEILKDGELLCKLGSLVSVAANPCSKYKNSKMPFVQMENISFFLKTCEMIGVPHDEIFQTIDLFEAKDPYQIIVTLVSFSRQAHENNPGNFPTLLGPKKVKVKPPIPNKPIRLQQRN